MNINEDETSRRNSEGTDIKSPKSMVYLYPRPYMKMTSNPKS